MTGSEVVIGPCHRVTEKLFARRQAERHELKQSTVYIQWKCPFGDQRAPCTITGIARRDVRNALLTDCRADAVGTDKQIRFDDFAIRKIRPDLIRILREFCETATTMISLGWKRVAQQAVDAFPGGQHLRAFDFVRQLPIRVENLAGRYMHTKLVGSEAQFAQPVDQLILSDNSRT